MGGGTETKNIYLNALSIRLDGLDLFAADGENSKLAQEWIDGLLNQENPVLKLAAHTFSSSKLKHLYFESKNNDRIFGASTLGFGYPIFQQSSEDEFIVAPLLIWKVKLENLQANTEKWQFQPAPGKSFFVNPYLQKHLLDRYQFDLAESFSTFFENGISQDQFEKFLAEIREKLGLEDLTFEENLTPGPGLSELAALDQLPSIRNSGYFGIFPPVISTHFQEAEIWWQELLQKDGLVKRDPDFHGFTYLPGDPWQESAFQEALRRKVSLITGAPGTGKTKICLNLIINALSNGQKCLVISSRLSALLNLQRQVSGIVEGPIHFLFKDPENEKSLLLEMLKASIWSEARTNYDEARWRVLSKKSHRDKIRLDENYQAVARKIFGTNSWTETVGLFIKNNKIEGKELLSSQLKTQDFSFSFEEYIGLEDRILHCKKLYDRVKTLQHPLQNLHPSIFKSINKKESFEFVKSHLKDYKTKAQELHFQFITTLDTYQSKLTTYFENQHQQFLQLHDSVKFLKEDAESQFGEDFTDSFFNWVGLKAIFSKRSKKILQTKQEIRKRFEALSQFYQQNQLFESNIHMSSGSIKMDEIDRSLSEFREELSGWQKQIPTNVQDEIHRLNTKTAYKNLDFKENISQLEIRMDDLISEINDSGLLGHHLENKMLTIPKRQHYLEEIIQQLEHLDLNMRDFDNFHDWQSYWLTVSEQGQKVVKALVKVKSENWQAAFESWFFHNTLIKNQSPDLPQNDDLLSDFVENFEEMLGLMPAQIKQLWEKKRIKASPEIKKKNRDLFHFFEGKSPKNIQNQTLSEIFSNATESITDILPLWFCTPEAVAHTFSEEEKWFDWVIIEEAGMISPAESMVAAKIGKQVLIVGDTGPHTNEGDPTLLELAFEHHIPKIHLSTKYSQNPESLHRFNLAAFQWQDEPALVSNSASPGVFSVEKMNGRFDEREGINEAEAHLIIKLLNKISQTPQRTYPAVGIACFTVQQRDLISNYLIELKQKNAPGSEIIQQLERNGFGVFYIGDMRAEHFDIVLVTLTFGAVNTNGKMTKMLEKLNTETGLQKIYTLTSCPGKQLTIVHSLPEEFLDSKEKKMEERGLFLLSNFIRYVEFLSSENSAMAEKILQTVQLKDTLPLATKNSIFMEEVATYLQPFFEHGRIRKNHQIGDITLPISIQFQNSDKKGVVMEAEGFLAKSPFTSYLWEYQQRKKIEEAGYEFFPVWSLEWWKNPEQQARKIAGQIISQEVNTTENREDEAL